MTTATRPRRPVWLRPVLAIGLLLLGACATGRALDSPFDSNSGRITIEVQNLNWSDATLWAYRGGQRVRLGIVGGKKDARFDIDWNFSQRLQIEIDLLAGNRCITPELGVDPNDIIELQIPIDLSSGSNCLR